jgi:hypothetical protein
MVCTDGPARSLRWLRSWRHFSAASCLGMAGRLVWPGSRSCSSWPPLAWSLTCWLQGGHGISAASLPTSSVAMSRMNRQRRCGRCRGSSPSTRDGLHCQREEHEAAVQGLPACRSRPGWRGDRMDHHSDREVTHGTGRAEPAAGTVPTHSIRAAATSPAQSERGGTVWRTTAATDAGPLRVEGAGRRTA